MEAFGNKKTTIKRLRAGTTNRSDVGGVLQRSNIHIKVAPEGEVAAALTDLKESPETARAKAKLVLATDGHEFRAEDMESGDIVVCDFPEFPEHFGFFLSLAGITTVKQIRESAFDIRATGRLNRLYVELLKENPDLGGTDRQRDMNHFMARLIFCFFAEDTDIFPHQSPFTSTVEQMSTPEGSNTHEVIDEIFRAMNTEFEDRETASLPRWADAFPYVNGGLFSDSTEVPRFSRTARSYLLHLGNLDWKKINPDIFGSMIQAVADDKERGSLGMHYTSVPNILKVLNPLFLDDLREQLKEAGGNNRKLLNLRHRMARIRVFDPACGSGNFLVVAYKEIRAIEAEINRRRRERGRHSDIPLTNFRGIEIRDFPAEVARLSLVIAEYQCDVLYLGQKKAVTVVLPLNKENWITCANALRLDWSSICPPTGTEVKHVADDLFESAPDQSAIDFRNEGGETYICGNPPYRGSQWQTAEQKADLKSVFDGRTRNWKQLDYVAGWFIKAADYGAQTPAASGFVTTNSICQGRQVATLWPLILKTGQKIAFAHTSFKWANLASQKAGVTVAIVGISNRPSYVRQLFSIRTDGETAVRGTVNINPYLVSGPDVLVSPRSKPMADLHEMNFGNMPNDDGNLLLDLAVATDAIRRHGVDPRFIRSFVGSQEFIHGRERRCIWVTDQDVSAAMKNEWLSAKFDAVIEYRSGSDRRTTRRLGEVPHRFGEIRQSGDETVIVVPRVSSENRPYLPVGVVPPGTIIGDRNFALFDAPLWNLALITSRVHWVWISTVCVRLRTDFSYSNTLGWNTFPLPKLTEQNRSDLTSCAEGILLAREAHFPATVAELYTTGQMPENLRAAHERNDEVLERVYIGRRFRNDTERLEKLFELYVKMTDK